VSQKSFSQNCLLFYFLPDRSEFFAEKKHYLKKKHFLCIVSKKNDLQKLTFMKNLIAAVALISIALLTNGGNSAGTQSNKTAAEKEQKVQTVHLTKADFLKKVANYETTPNEWKYLGDKPCLIDFYADWCGPCKMIAPVLEELAAEYGGKIYIYKINTEKERELAALFNIRSIPTMLFVPQNGQPQMAVGALPKAQLKEAIDMVLLNGK
jgi:thioredoxin